MQTVFFSGDGFMGLFDGVMDVIKPISSVVGDVAPLVASAFAGAGQQATNQANVDIAASNNAWSASQYASRYQTQVKDLQAAGLNPMLAYMQSPGSAPTAQPVTYQNPSAAAVNAYQSVKGADSGAARDYASAAQAGAEIGRINAATDQIVEQTKNIPQEGKRLFQATQLLAHQVNLTMSQEELTNTQRQQVLAVIKKLREETSLLNLDVSAAKQFDNLGREASQLKPIIDLIRPFIHFSR